MCLVFKHIWKKNRWWINIAVIQLIKTDIICFKTLLRIISRGSSGCYFNIRVDLFWGPGSQRKRECLHFNFLSVSRGNTKLKTITCYFRGPSNSRSSIKSKKRCFPGDQCCSVYGNKNSKRPHRCWKPQGDENPNKDLPVAMGLCKRNQWLQKQENAALAKKNEDEQRNRGRNTERISKKKGFCPLLSSLSF